MFEDDGFTDAELSRLLDILFDAEATFGKVYGSRSTQATEMYALSFILPLFIYEDVKCEHRKLLGECKYPGCSSHVYDSETGEFLGYQQNRSYVTSNAFGRR